MTTGNQEPFALITGASEGIGRAIAIRMGTLGYNVALMSRNVSKGPNLKKQQECAEMRMQALILG